MTETLMGDAAVTAKEVNTMASETPTNRPWRIEARPAHLRGRQLYAGGAGNIVRIWRECLDEGEDHQTVIEERITTGRFSRGAYDREESEARGYAEADNPVECDWWFECAACGVEELSCDYLPSGALAAMAARVHGFHRVRARRTFRWEPQTAVWICGACWNGEEVAR